MFHWRTPECALKNQWGLQIRSSEGEAGQAWQAMRKRLIHPTSNWIIYPYNVFFVGSFDTLRWRVLGRTWVFSTVQNASIIGFKWSFVNAAWLLEYSKLHCIQSSFFKRHTVRIMTFGKEMSWFIQQYFAFWPSWSCRFWGLLVCCSFAKRAIRAAWMFTRVLAILVSYQNSTYLGKKTKRFHPSEATVAKNMTNSFLANIFQKQYEGWNPFLRNTPIRAGKWM